MKKLSAFIVAFLMIFGFAACEGKKDKNASPDKQPQLSSAVVDEVKSYFNDLGIESGEIEEEYKLTENGANFYVVSGRFAKSLPVEGDDNEDVENYENGYFFGIAYEFDGETEFTSLGIFEEDDEDEFNKDLESFVDGCKENEADVKVALAELAAEKETAGVA